MPSDDRIWTIEPDETGEVDPDELAAGFLECAAIVRRIGGAFTIAARRRQVEPGVYLTESVVVGWKPHLPMKRRARRERDQLRADVEEAREEAGELSDEEMVAHFPEQEESPEPVGAE